jgi:hypothetical protein
MIVTCSIGPSRSLCLDAHAVGRGGLSRCPAASAREEVVAMTAAFNHLALNENNPWWALVLVLFCW